MEGGNGGDLFSTKAKKKEKKKKIFVHQVARFVLNDSKETLFHFYLLYTLFD